MVPAWSTRTKKKGTPRAPVRCSVERRWATCSIEASKAQGQRLEVVAERLGAARGSGA